jgi:clan AA aspartic protease (TIGR02281 family)
VIALPVSPRVKLLPAVLAVAAVIATPSLVAAEPLTQCQAGQQVIDNGGSPGEVVSERNGLCLIRSPDGRNLSWVPRERLSLAPPAEPAAPAPDTPAPAPGAPAPAPGTRAPAPSEGVRILRPILVNQLVYPADALGHIVLAANVNGAPVRFLVDNGATLVSLTPEDASAAGLKRSELTFDQTVQTGNGPAHAAFVQLRDIRIEQLDVDDVQAAVIDNLKQSVLGMSFLSRLKRVEMRGGMLTMSW